MNVRVGGIGDWLIFVNNRFNLGIAPVPGVLPVRSQTRPGELGLSASPCHVVVTVFFSSGAGDWFECGVESEEEFSHDGGQSEFVRFALGAQTLIKTR